MITPFQSRPRHMVVMFFLLVLALFLGDGKQSVVDVFGSAIVVTTYIYWMFLRRTHQSMPPRLTWAWVAVWACVFMSTFFSESLGFSISWLVRLSSVFLVYRLFFDLPKPLAKQLFLEGLTILVAIAGVGGVVFSFFPIFSTLLPSMNLLSTSYGHSHLADLLVFAAPIFLHYFTHGGVSKKALFLAYIALVIFTASRGAWLLLSGYFLFEAAARLGKTKRAFFVGVVSVTLLVFMASSLWLSKDYTPQVNTQKNQSSFFLRADPAKSRLEYWRQAVVATQEKPIFGHGPGTFSLLSYRLQAGFGSGSWFAHSFPLQVASEMGLVGLVAFGLLFAAHIKNAKDERVDDANKWTIVTTCLMLVGAYSLYEFVFDYYITWLMFFAGLGAIAPGGAHDDSKQARRGQVMTWVAVSIIGGFYVLWVTSNLFLLGPKKYDVAVQLAPFDATVATAYFTLSPTMDSFLMNLALFFHQKNSEVIASYAKRLPPEKDTVATDMFIKSMMLSPHNNRYRQEFLSYVRDQRSVYGMKRFLQYFCERFRVTSCTLQNEEVAIILDVLIREREGTGLNQTKNNSLERLFYRLGLSVLDEDPSLTAHMWTLARDAGPQWSYFHIELAGLYAHVFQNTQKARQILMLCKAYPSAAEHCEDVLKGEFLKPATLKGEIDAIF